MLRKHYIELIGFIRMFPDTMFAAATLAMAWIILVITMMTTQGMMDKPSYGFLLVIPGTIAIMTGWVIHQRHTIESEFADEIIVALSNGTIETSSTENHSSWIFDQDNNPFDF